MISYLKNLLEYNFNFINFQFNLKRKKKIKVLKSYNLYACEAAQARIDLSRSL